MGQYKHQLDLFEAVTFHDDGNDIDINLALDPDAETIWATKAQMAEVFGVNITKIGELTEAIFKDGELNIKEVTEKFPITDDKGKTYREPHYSLDVILSVGYRVSSAKATKFRQWATKIIKEFILEGFVIDEARVSGDVEAAAKLTKKIRKLRTKETNVFKAIRDAFTLTADYNKDDPETQKFFKNLTDKFQYAATEKTSSQIITERANHQESDMGLRSKKGLNPTKSDTTVGKNYLNAEELELLYLVCDQFLTILEVNAARGIPVTMKELREKFVKMLELNDLPVLIGFGTVTRKSAEKHAHSEYNRYKQRMRLEKTSKNSTRAMPAPSASSKSP